MPKAKPRIAILGGGPAGLSAAFHLVRDGRWQDRFESITVYQLGWRLGGKGATGREEGLGWRLAEHGIHGFCNFYWNTFRMMEKVYSDLSAEHRAWLPLDDHRSAFPPSSLTFTVEETKGGRLRGATGTMPNSPGDPWEGSLLDLQPKRLVRRILEEMKRRWRRGPGGPGGPFGFEDLLASPASQQVPASQREAARAIDDAIDRRLAALAQEPEKSLESLTPEWKKFIEEIQSRAALLYPQAAQFAETDTGTIVALRAVTSLQIYAALLLGLFLDGVLSPDFDLDELDRKNYLTWLKDHGAAPDALKSSTAKSVAHILFAYPHGDTAKQPSLSTASWLNWIFRSLLGRGDYFYFLGAGTGETVILPLYLYLCEREVQFAFFHKLVGVGSGGSTLDRLSFQRQAQTSGTPYDPLVVLPGHGPVRVWPAKPVWSRLAQPDEGEDLEAWEPTPIHVPLETLERGQDFDYVVWALPPTMIELVGDPEFQKRLAKPASLSTTATSAAQIWLQADTKDLGWARSGTERYASASFPNPLNGMVGFDDVIAFEAWKPPAPKGLFYLCGQHPTSGPVPESERPKERERVRNSALATLARMGDLMGPQARDPKDPRKLRADLLYCATAPPPGSDRIDCQYVRVNTRPTEAYVQAPPASAPLRPQAWETGYENVVVAGDWIYTGFNLGSFESAVTGGALAAFALSGTPDFEDIEGFTFRHPSAAKAAAQAKASGVVPRIP